MSDHSIELERTTLLALGSLDAAEAQLAEQHLQICLLCRAEYAELYDVAGLIGCVAEPDSDEHILRLARAKKRLRSAIRKPTTPYAAQPWYTGFAFQRIAAAVAVFIIGGTVVYDTLQVHTTEMEMQTAQRSLAMLLSPDAHCYMNEHGAIVRKGSNIYFVLQHLPKLPQGHVYQAWTKPMGTTHMKPSMTFVVNDDGSAYVELPDDATRIAAVALSVEPQGGSQQPTTAPMIVQPFS